MTPDPVTISEDTPLEAIVALMAKNKLKRLPVMRGENLVGIVSRANLVRAVASLARDDHIRDRIINALGKNDWCSSGRSVIVREGIVNLSGIITDERSRQAAMVCVQNIAGVKKVHDHLCWIDPDVRNVLYRTGRRGMAKAS